LDGKRKVVMSFKGKVLPIFRNEEDKQLAFINRNNPNYLIKDWEVHHELRQWLHDFGDLDDQTVLK
jgi:hypothetical protein